MCEQAVITWAVNLQWPFVDRRVDTFALCGMEHAVVRIYYNLYWYDFMNDPEIVSLVT